MILKLKEETMKSNSEDKAVNSLNEFFSGLSELHLTALKHTHTVTTELSL